MTTLVSAAFEFDNTKEVKEEIGKAGYYDLEIKNAFGLGETLWIGSLDMNTHSCNINCKAIQTINLTKPGSLVDEVVFEKLESRTKTIVDYKLYIKIGEEPYQKGDYEQVCSGSPLDDDYAKSCTSKKIGEHTEYLDIWEEYIEGTELKAGIYELKLEGTKSRYVNVDWIYKTQGVTLSEWASWTSNLDVGLTDYFKFDETVGNFTANSVRENINMTAEYEGTEQWVTGIINNGYNSSFDSNRVLNMTDAADAELNHTDRANWSISFWIATESNGAISGNEFFHSGLTAPRFYIGMGSGTNLLLAIRNDAAQTRSLTGVDNLPIGEFTHVVINHGGDGGDGTIENDVKVYINGTLGNMAGTGVLGTYSGFATEFQVGEGLNNMNGTIDEMALWNRTLTVAEISDLYNNGLGISFGVSSLVTLHTPEDNAEFLDRLVVFNATVFASSGASLVNMSLYHNQTGTFHLNKTISVSGDNSTSTISQTFKKGTILWNIESCDDSGTCGFGSNNRTLNIIDVVINSETFNNNTIEGSTENFILNVSITPGISISEALFIYDGVTSEAQISSDGTNQIIAKLGFIIPDVGPQINLSFNWILNLSDSSAFITDEKNQTVSNLSIGACSGLTNNIMNLTLVDEETQVVLTENITIETAFNLFSLDGSVNVANFSGNFTNSTIAICLNIDLLNNTNYSLNAVIRYEAQDHANEYYNIDGFILSNSTPFQNITLFDLLSDDSTNFRLSFTGEDFLPAEDVLVFVERQYIRENVFKTVELPKTDSNGQTILHLVVNDVVYNLIFLKDGIVLKIFRNLRAFCDDPSVRECAISLNALSDQDAVLVYDQEIGIVYAETPTYNSSTNIVSFAFTSFDGSVKNVTMDVQRKDIFGNNSVCSNSLNSIGGVLSCNIGSGITDTTLETVISVDGNPKIISQVIIDDSAYGVFGFVAVFLMILGLVLTFSKDKNGILLALLIGYIGSAGLGLLLGGIIGVGSAGIWILVITLVGLWRLNKNKFD